MIAEMLTYLRDPASPLSALPFALYRDDDAAPFNDPASTPAVLRQQGAPKGRDLSGAQFDLWLFTKAGADGPDEAALFDLANAVELYVIENYRTDKIIHIEVLSGAAGPFRDAQKRSAVQITLNVTRNTGE